MSGISQGLLTNSLGTWKEEPESDSSGAEEGSKLTGDVDDTASVRSAEEVVEEGPLPPPEGQCIRSAAEAYPPGPPGLELDIVQQKDEPV